MTDRYVRWRDRKTAEQCVKQLRGRGYDAALALSVNAAQSMILKMVTDYETFGFGGSMTTRAMGLIEELRIMGKTVYDHWDKTLSAESVAETRKRQGRCDCFLCSANAITVDGEIVNIDGIGNRASAMMFGPRKVIVVAGVNKIARNLPDALARAKNVAAPIRAKSLGCDTPCAETGFCTDCRSPRRICCITTIFHQRPQQTDMSVILINEDMGY
ncbi:MAG: lactate utilization protein [Desulfobacterales bacterium]